jgi:predicted MFS family arabinose efflux permease
MTLMSFALISSEFMPVALLTPIGAELGMTEGQTGQAIAFSGLFAVLTSLFSNSVFARTDRKTVVMFYTGVMVVSGLAVTFAPNAVAFMIGRALTGMAIGGFFSISTAIAARIASGDDLVRVLTWIQAGSALAAVLAQPVGSFLGGLIGWRGAFFTVVPIGILALVLQAMVLPSVPSTQAMPVSRTLGMLSKRRFAVGMIAMTLFFVGQFALSTYLRPYLEGVTHLGISSLSLTLFILGLSGLAGTLLVGHAIRRFQHGLLIGAPVGLVVISVALIGLGAHFMPVVLVLILWGFLTSPIPAVWGDWMTRVIPDDLEPGGAMFVALIQTAITCGAFVGGVLFDTFGWQAAFAFAGASFTASALVAARMQR